MKSLILLIYLICLVGAFGLETELEPYKGRGIDYDQDTAQTYSFTEEIECFCYTK